MVERVIIEVLCLFNRNVMYCVMIFLFVSLLLFWVVDLLWVVSISCIRFCCWLFFCFWCWWIIFMVIWLKYFIFFFRCIIMCKRVLRIGKWLIMCNMKGKWKDFLVFLRNVLFGLVWIFVLMLKVVERIIFKVRLLY